MPSSRSRFQTLANSPLYSGCYSAGLRVTPPGLARRSTRCPLVLDTFITASRTRFRRQGLLVALAFSSVAFVQPPPSSMIILVAGFMVYMPNAAATSMI